MASGTSSPIIERIAAGCVGAVLGCVLGVGLQLAWMAVSSASSISASFVFSIGALGAALCAALGSGIANGVVGLLALLWGFIQGVGMPWTAAGDEPAGRPPWVVVLVVLEFAAGVAAVVVSFY
jgi:hypothetical protein